ncbi:MAG: outer membrane beta-barrel protein [Alcanivoracaceae bacterium]|jgi:hypothetical protein|nr:outer membrane beta-barrel protein [Alcanivoracaceae bacterium]
MKRICALVLASGLAALGTSAHAADETHNYIGIGAATIEQSDRYGLKDLGVNNSSDVFETQDAFIKFGGKVNRYVGVELRAGGTLSDTEETKQYIGGSGDFSYRHDYWAGGYVRLQYPISIFVPYVQGGVVRVTDSFELRATNGGPALLNGDSSYYDSSMAAGLEINLLGKLSINGEYFLLSDGNPEGDLMGDAALISQLDPSGLLYEEKRSSRQSGFAVGLSWHF